MKVRTGSYIGNATNDRQINVVASGETPVAVILSGNYFKIADHPAGSCSPFANDAPNQTNIIKNLTPNGFTVGTSASANSNGVRYYYTAFFNDGNDDLITGKYTGDGINNRLIDTGVVLKLVLIKGNSSHYGWWKTSSNAGLATMGFAGFTDQSDRIRSLPGSGGFTLDLNVESNENGIDFYYMAVASSSPWVTVGSFTGNATDDRNIPGLTFPPAVVWIKANNPISAITRTSAMVGDLSRLFASSTDLANAIQALNADGFQVGSYAGVNENNTPIRYAAFGLGYTVNTEEWTAIAECFNPVNSFWATARPLVKPSQTWLSRAYCVNKTIAGPLSTMPFRSVDVMKLSKDGTTHQLSDAQIENVVNFIRDNINVTHIGPAANIDPVEWAPVGYVPSPRSLVNLYKKWANTIHATGLRVLHRMEMFSIQNKSSDTHGFLWRVGSNRYPQGSKSEIIPTTWTDGFNRLTIPANVGNISYGTPVVFDFNIADTAQASNSIGSGLIAGGSAGGGWNIQSNQLRLFRAGNVFTYSIARTTATYGNALYELTVQKQADGRDGMFFCLAGSGSDPFYKGYVVSLVGSNQVILEDVAKLLLSPRQKIASGTVATPFVTNSFYKIKVEKTGILIKVKVWLVTDSEPADWLFQVYDNSYSSGYVGATSEVFGKNVLFDNLTITPITFSNFSSSWTGSGKWGIAVNNAQVSDVQGEAYQNILYTSTAYTNVTYKAEVRTPSGPGKVGLVFRVNLNSNPHAANNYSGYIARIRDNAFLDLETLAGTNIATVPKAISSDTPYMIKIEAIGTSIKIKTWATGDDEPSAWDIELTNSLYTTGGMGFAAEDVTSAIFDKVEILIAQNLNSLLGIVYSYIMTNSEIFANGDILAPFPEKTAGSFNDSTSWLSHASPGIIANYTNFFNDLKDVADYAFQQLGLNVITGHSSNNFSEIKSGWLPPSFFSHAGIVVTDWYGNADLGTGAGTVSWDGNLTVTGIGTNFTSFFTAGNFIVANGLRAEIASVDSSTQLTLRTKFFTISGGGEVIGTVVFNSTPFSNKTYTGQGGFREQHIYNELNNAYNNKGGLPIEVQEWAPVPDMIAKTFTGTNSPSIPERGFAMDATLAHVYREQEVVRPFLDALTQLHEEGKMFGFNWWGFWNTGENDTGLMGGNYNTYGAIKLRRDGRVLAEYFNAGTTPHETFWATAKAKKGGGRLGDLPIKGLDLMKWTKDTVASQPSDATIENIVKFIYENIEVTHLAIVLPIDPLDWYPVGFTPSPRTVLEVYKKWCDTIHSYGIKVIHRCVMFGEEGLSNFTLRVGLNRYPVGTVSDVLNDVDRESYLGIFYDFIVDNPGLFVDGDIWAPFPESTENSTQYYALSSLTRVGTLATLVTTLNHNTRTGESISLEGVSTPGWSGPYIVTKINDTTLTFTVDGDETTPAVTTGAWLVRGRSIFHPNQSFISHASPGIQTNFANFFIWTKQVSDAAFQVIGKDVITGKTANNYSEIRTFWLLQALFNSDEAIAFDYYGGYDGSPRTPAQQVADAEWAYDNRGHHPLFWQEWGTTPDMITLQNLQNNEDRKAFVSDFLSRVAVLFESGKLNGFNYWGFWDTGDNDSGILKLNGSSALYGSYELRGVGQVLAEYFDDGKDIEKWTAKALVLDTITETWTALARAARKRSGKRKIILRK